MRNDNERLKSRFAKARRILASLLASRNPPGLGKMDFRSDLVVVVPPGPSRVRICEGWDDFRDEVPLRNRPSLRKYERRCVLITFSKSNRGGGGASNRFCEGQEEFSCEAALRIPPGHRKYDL